ncbi:MAG: hypothetical protein ACW99U_13270 [Candidatus Thorarchaeota archaeon]|jgi:hypothetical protein
MPIRYTEKVSYILLAVTLLSPFYVMIQFVSPDNVPLVFLAPLWQYFWSTNFGGAFNPTPFALVYVFWYWPGLYISKLAYDATKKQDRDRYDYAQKIVLLIIVQVVFTLLLPPASGSPPPFNVPLPIVGLVALLLTGFTVEKLDSPWEGQENSTDGET